MNTDELLTRVGQYAQLPPQGDEDFTNEQILYEATQALYSRYAQPFQAIRSGYWLHQQVVQLTANQPSYRMPPRAIVQGLEKLEFSTDRSNWVPLNILTQFQATDYTGLTSGQPQWFTLDADRVTLFPAPSAGYYLRMTYYLRPSKLIEYSNVGTVTTVNSSTLITVANDPTSLFGDSTTMDFVNTDGTGEVAIPDVTYGTITSVGFGFYTIAIPGGIDTSLVQRGQVVRAADTTDIVPLPVELGASLAAYTAGMVLLAKGDAQKAGSLFQKSDADIKRIVDAALPRIKSRPYLFKTRNTYLRSRLGGRYW